MKENIEYLQRLGFSAYQARAMVIIFSRGEVTAREVSKMAEIPYTRVYEILDFLEYREFITSNPGKPRHYRGVDPEKVISNLIQREQKKLDSLKEEVENQISALNDLEVEPKEMHPALAVAPYNSL